MGWIKRNLFLVTGGLVGLALLGLAGFYLYTRLDAETEVTDKLDEATKKLDQLVNEKDQPGSGAVDNIKAAKQQEEQLVAVLTQTRKIFPTIDVTNRVRNAQEFKELLSATVIQLRHDAEESGVSLLVVGSTNYDFTFNAQRPLIAFTPTNSINPIAVQLAEVSAISEILFHAKVHALDGLRRVRMSGDDTNAANTRPQDYLMNRVATTNALGPSEDAIVTPYEVTFRGMKRELEAVLDGLAHAREFFIVRNMVVEPAPPLADDQQSLEPGAGGMTPGNPYYNMMRGGYGRYSNPYSRYGMMPPPQAMPPSMVKKTETVLEEKKLRIRLLIEIVKLKPRK
jgi:hypothetical protein